MPGLLPAASALVLRERTILFVRNTRTPDRWAFPGGKAEEGETPEQTAIREIKEEVGLDIELVKELGRYVTASGFEIVCFVATAGTPDLRIDTTEIVEARWFDLREALNLDLIPTVRDALQDFRAAKG